MKLKKLKPSQLSSLPRQAGVYIFYGAKKSSLYIGKASNLKERIKNHFQQPTYKDNLFVNKVKKIGYIPLESDIEALIFESQLIKKYQPKFNILFRDDKKYFYVGITQEGWPRIFLTHQPYLETYKLKNLQTDFIGPFTDGGALKQTLKILRKTFPYRTCKVLPKRPCLWYNLGRCPAPCLIEREKKIRKTLKKETDFRKRDYKEDIKKLSLILKGKRRRLILKLEKEMENMAGLEEFERAAKIKNQIESLERIFSHKKILTETSLTPLKEKKINVGVLLKKSLGLSKIPKKIEGYDISNIKAREMAGSMVTFRLSKIPRDIEEGLWRFQYTPDKSRYRRFKIKTVKKQNDIACLKEIIKRRLSHQEWKLPDLIFVDGGKSQLNAAKEIIGQFSKKEIPIISLAKRKNLLYNVISKKPLPLDKFPQEVKMTILHLRDESHRFAISYHKTLREKVFFL